MHAFGLLQGKARRALTARVVLACLVVSAPVTARAGTVVLHAYDEAGTLLSTQAFLDRTMAAPKGWRTDLTYRIADGTTVAHWPIVNSGGLPAFEVPEAGVGLALSWNTASTGFSTLFLDDAGTGLDDGILVLNERAALDLREKLNDALARRPGYVASASFTSTLAEADSLLASAAVAATEPERAVLSQSALDLIVRAFEMLLREYGLARARTLAVNEWWGVTVDRLDDYPAVLGGISALVEGDAGRAYVRIVFDVAITAEYYDGIVASAAAAGLVVVGEILDSFDFSFYDQAGFEARVREYVDRFPAVEVWEVGNEINGEWLGSGVAAKIAYAAQYVKSKDPTDRTMLTFYWQMGTAGAPGNTLFQWIHDNVDAGLRANLDVIALSAWIGDAPLGAAHDEVYERLHALFPSQRIVMGELGYWSPGTTRAWWWRSQVDPTGTVRRALADHMYLANFAFDYADGGVFWWFYFDEMHGMTPLWQTVNDAYRSIHGCDDADADLACDFQDNCPVNANADQADADADGLGDVCDLLCPAGDRITMGKMTLDLRGGAEDRLNMKAWVDAAATIDPAADGMRVRVETTVTLPFDTVLLDVVLGGPGAPVPFVERSGAFRYTDTAGAVAGIARAQVKPVRGSPGLFTFKLKGKAMDVPAVATASARLLLDFSTGCSETSSNVTVCELRTDGTRLTCY